MLRISGGALGLALCVAGLAVGQEVTAERPAPGTTENRRVSQILGSTVQLNDGSGYGKVEDIVLGPDNRVEYLVVSHEEQFVMLPWTAGQFDVRQRVVIYDVAPQAIQPMLFAPDAWPNIADPAFVRRVQTAFPRARLGQGLRRESLRPAPAAAPEEATDPDRPRAERKAERKAEKAERKAERKAARPDPGAAPAPVAPSEPPKVDAPAAAPGTDAVPPREKAKRKRSGDAKVQP